MILDYIKGIFSDSAAKVTDSVMKGLDGLFTSDEERKLIEAKIKQAVLDSQLETQRLLNEKFSEELKEQTKRWISDNENGNWLTRSVRPYAMGLTVTVVMFVFVAVGFGWMTFEPSILNALLMFAGGYVGFYTTSRGAEKISNIKISETQKK